MALRRLLLASFLLNPHALHRRLRAPLDLFQRHGFIGRPDRFNRFSCIVRLLPPYHGLSTAHGRHLLSPHQYPPGGRGVGLTIVSTTFWQTAQVAAAVAGKCLSAAGAFGFVACAAAW